MAIAVVQTKTVNTKSATRACWLAFLAAILVTPVYSAEPRIEVYTESTALDGHANELVADALAEAGYEADFIVVPWTRLINKLETTPNVLGFSMTRTPDREERFHWIGKIRPVTFMLWGLRERADELPQSLDEAREFRISALRDDVVSNYLASIGFTNLIYLSQSSDTLTMLRRDRIDLMAYVEFGMEEYLASKNAPADTLIPVVSLEEISTGHYLVMSKQSDQDLVDLFRTAFEAVVSRRQSN